MKLRRVLAKRQNEPNVKVRGGYKGLPSRAREKYGGRRGRKGRHQHLQSRTVTSCVFEKVLG